MLTTGLRELQRRQGRYLLETSSIVPARVPRSCRRYPLRELTPVRVTSPYPALQRTCDVSVHHPLGELPDQGPGSAYS
jgi:hypothetical protein